VDEEGTPLDDQRFLNRRRRQSGQRHGGPGAHSPRPSGRRRRGQELHCEALPVQNLHGQIPRHRRGSLQSRVRPGGRHTKGESWSPLNPKSGYNAISLRTHAAKPSVRLFLSLFADISRGISL